VIIFVHLLLHSAQVSLRIVGCSRWRHHEVLSIFARATFAFSNGALGPLVEAKAREFDNFVVHESTKDQNGETNEAKGFNWITKDQNWHAPDSELTARINGGTLSGRSILGSSDTEWVEKSDWAHIAKVENKNNLFIGNLVPSKRRIFKETIVAKRRQTFSSRCAALDNLHDR